MKILYVVKNMRLSNGVSSYAMNYYRQIKNKADNVDFLVVSDVGSPYYQEIKKDGNHVYLMPSYKREPFRIKTFLRKIFRENQYNIIHCNVVNSGSLILMEAEKAGIPVRILHSHATRTGDTKWKEIRNKFFRSLSIRHANHFFACSRLAGDFLFEGRPYTVINNAIAFDKYKFDPEIRRKLRIEENTGNLKVVATVGRMTPQKNPFFIVDVVKELKEKKNNFIFWWFGDGELEKEIREYADKQGVSQKIKYFGACNNVYEYYSAMDVFILPSVYEGLPVVGIEAQASGLPCIFADTVTKEAAICDAARFLPINKPILWAETIEDKMNTEKRIGEEELKIDQYRIESQARLLLEKYRELTDQAGGRKLV